MNRYLIVVNPVSCFVTGQTNFFNNFLEGVP